MGEHAAFFYGTLMAPPVLHRVIYGSTKPEHWQKDLTTVRPALLQGFRRHKVKYADYPGILPHTQSSVRGTLVTGLTAGDIWRLDVFEGAQYKRKKVSVTVLKNTPLHAAVDEERLQGQVEEEVEAETYVWCSHPEELEEHEWDFEEFKKEKMWAWTGERHDPNVQVDDGFEDVDRAVKEEEEKEKEKTRDPTGGRGIGGRITRELESVAA